MLLAEVMQLLQLGFLTILAVIRHQYGLRILQKTAKKSEIMICIQVHHQDLPKAWIGGKVKVNFGLDLVFSPIWIFWSLGRSVARSLGRSYERPNQIYLPESPDPSTRYCARSLGLSYLYR